MLDYPRDQVEFDALIASEEACRAYLAAIRCRVAKLDALAKLV